MTTEQEATRENLEYWVDNMRRFHDFTWEEVSDVTGYEVDEIKEIAKGFGKPIQPKDDVVTILPYPVGDILVSGSWKA